MEELMAYPEYKDSGVEWIGKVPNHWKVVKLKHLANIVTGNTPPKSNEENYLNGTYSWVKPDNFNADYTISETNEKLSEQGAKLARIIPKNSALVCCIGTVGKVAINNESVTTNQQINSIVFNNEKWISEYGVFASISAEQEFQRYANKVVISILNKTAQENVFMPLPSTTEQKYIGGFIRGMTYQIDSLISDKERLIELLEEKRQAVITETVTKGLDPYVKMKDSGIEWIGEIPAHWDAVKIKRLTQIKRGASPRPIDAPKYFDDNGKYSWVRIADVSSSNKYLYETKEKLSSIGSSLSVKLEPGQIIVSIAGTVGKAAITKINCCIHDGFVYFPQYNESIEYLYYLFDTEQPYLGLGKKGTQLNLNTETIGNISIPLPPKNEQNDIVKYIKDYSRIQNDLCKILNTQISKLKEYRESIIYEAVTGKIDVRDYVSETEEVN